LNYSLLSVPKVSVWIVDSPNTRILAPCAIALGNFDGLHLGHQTVLQPILQDCSAYPTVVSFTPHPREFFTGEKRQLLTPLAEKVQVLEDLGFKQLVLLPFSAELASLGPLAFVEQILVKQLQAKYISVGQDFHFGYRRQGTAQDLFQIASQFNIKVEIVGLKNCAAGRISSSLIRQALGEGNVQQAEQMLGRPYSLTGRVIVGQQVGRKLGFHTANLQVPPDKLLPRLGVYCGWVHLDGSSLPAVMNIGYRPTIAGKSLSVEIHLLDWSGDLYDRILTMDLVQFLRPEQKFNSLEELKNQIATDCDRSRLILERCALGNREQ
jgi:riboflavin kinase / FMN adenylyltransferase